jgi:hypothetical protein
VLLVAETFRRQINGVSWREDRVLRRVTFRSRADCPV